MFGMWGLSVHAPRARSEEDSIFDTLEEAWVSSPQFIVGLFAPGNPIPECKNERQ